MASSRRNLRPRKEFVAEKVVESPSRRTPRQSRARVKANDFLIYDNAEEESDSSPGIVESENEESEEEVPSRSSRRTPRSTRRSVNDFVPTSRRRRAAAASFVEPKQEEEEEEEEEAPQIPSSRSRSRAEKSSTTSRSSRQRSSRAKNAREETPEDDEPSGYGRSRRRRSAFNIDFVPEDAAARDDSDSYSSVEEEDEDDIAESESDVPESEDDFGGASSSRSSGRKKKRGSSRPKPSSSRKRQPPAPKILLPEDVPFREPLQEQPEQDPDEVEYNPLVAYVAIFVATFPDLFADMPTLPSPQDIEEGLLGEEPGETVDWIFRRLLVLVLNRKKELEIGRYSSALSELHSLRAALGVGPWFPPINWKSRSSAFKELDWVGRLEFLNVLIHWSLTNSDRVRGMLKNLPEDLTMPWMGVDEAGSHYYIVGFDPTGPDSVEYTRFRIYKESNRLLANVSWRPVASNSAEVIEFLKQHLKPVEEQVPGQNANTEDVKAETDVKEEDIPNSDINVEPTTHEEVNVDVSATGEEHPSNLPPTEPSKYNLPATVVEILSNLLPSMILSEETTAARLAKEAKRARRRNFLFAPVPTPRNEDRHRRRRNRVDFFDFVRQSDMVEEDDSRSRKRRRRDETYEEPEPETRQQRHARLLADKQERIHSEVPESEVPEAETQEDVEVQTEPHTDNHASSTVEKGNTENVDVEMPQQKSVEIPTDDKKSRQPPLRINTNASPASDERSPMDFLTPIFEQPVGTEPLLENPPTIPAASEPIVSETVASNNQNTEPGNTSAQFP